MTTDDDKKDKEVLQQLSYEQGNLFFLWMDEYFLSLLIVPNALCL